MTIIIILNADKNRLTVRQREAVTSGSVNANAARFEFSPEWEGLVRTAVFKAGGVSRCVLLDESGECSVPWEVLEKPGAFLQAGVCGTRGGEVVLPTVWAGLGVILEGAAPGESAKPPTPGIYEQVLAAAQEAADMAQSVREDADAGAFNGPPGVTMEQVNTAIDTAITGAVRRVYHGTGNAV